MAFDISLITRLSGLLLSIGNEGNLYDLVREYAEPYGFVVSKDNMNNIIAKKNRGERAAILAPGSSRSFVIRYIDQDGTAFLHTELKEWKKLIGAKIAFPGGVETQLEKSDKGKLIAKVKKENDFIHGHSAQLVKNCRLSADGCTLYGRDIYNLANIYTLLETMKRVKEDITVAFVSQHGAAKCNGGGKRLLAQSLHAETYFFIDAVEGEKSGPFIEMGDANYILSSAMRARLESAQIKWEPRVHALGGAVAPLMEALGADGMGIGIALEKKEEEVRLKEADLTEVAEFLSGWIGGAHARD
ncbi:hypothetical protein LJC27_05985 [Christensenellaceae bacterium OttesenSCG-928-M15]|nr:hypothetical protein [Christensenellaceae bacterium OttesenSCG-928-M15]